MSAVSTSVEFTEQFKWPGAREVITFDYQSYTKWMLELFPQFEGSKPIQHTKAKKHAIRVGQYLFFNRLMPMEWYYAEYVFMKPRLVRSALELYRRSTVAYCNFDAPVGIPTLCDSEFNPWMSLTPNEVLTQRGQIRRARGHVGMAGLGLGWAARRVLDRPGVKSLTVVERDPGVIEFFGGQLQAKFGDRVKFVCGDAYQFDWTQFDVSLWDVWPKMGDAGWDSRYKAIQRRVVELGKVCVGWGDIGTDY